MVFNYVPVKAGRGSGCTIKRSVPIWVWMSRRRVPTHVASQGFTSFLVQSRAAWTMARMMIRALSIRYMIR